MSGRCRLPAHEGLHPPPFAGVHPRPLQVVGHRREAREVLLDEQLRCLLVHAGVARQAEVGEPVDHAEVDDLGDPALIRCHHLRRHVVHLGSGAAVDVLAALERSDELRLAADVGEHAKLDLGIVGAHQLLTRVGDERVADPLPPGGAHRHVLQVGVSRAEPAGGGHRLVEGGVHATSRRRTAAAGRRRTCSSAWSAGATRG